MQISLNFMGYDFIVEVDYEVTSYGSPEAWTQYGGDPSEPPEYEINSIFLYQDFPADTSLPLRGPLRGPAVEATGALFDCLSNLDKICEALEQEITYEEGTNDAS